VKVQEFLFYKNNGIIPAPDRN